MVYYKALSSNPTFISYPLQKKIVEGNGMYHFALT